MTKNFIQKCHYFCFLGIILMGHIYFVRSKEGQK